MSRDNDAVELYRLDLSEFDVIRRASLEALRQSFGFEYSEPIKENPITTACWADQREEVQRWCNAGD